MVTRILITGANAGLGKESARQLALLDTTETVYLGCRNPTKAAAAKAELEQVTGKSIFEVVLIDVMDLDSVRAAASALPKPIDCLIMNAGGMGGSTPAALTAQGASHIFAVNVLGHALLVDELIAADKLSGVVMYAGSEAARGVKPMRMPPPGLKTTSADEIASVIDGSFFGAVTDPMRTYGPTKYIAALWIGAMARKHPAIRFVTMSPGGTTGTAAADAMGGFQGFMMKYVAMPMMSLFGMMHGLEVGAARYVVAVSDDQYKSGRFYASPGTKMKGDVVDQATIFPDVANEAFQDNANEAIHRFLT